MVGRENIDRSVFVGADMVPAASVAYAIGHPGTVRSARPVIPWRWSADQEIGGVFNTVDPRCRPTLSTHARQAAVGLR